MPALGTCPLKCMGNARSWDMPFKMFATSPLLRHALQNVWDRPALWTCPLKCLEHARSWDMPFKMFGTCPLLEHARLHDRNRIPSVIMSCGHSCHVSSQTVFAYNTSLRTSNSFALLCALKGGPRFVRHAKWRAVGNSYLGPIELKLLDACLTPEQKGMVENTTGCTPDVRYRSCTTHRSMLIVYGPLDYLHAAAELAEAFVDYNACVGQKPNPANYSQPSRMPIVQPFQQPTVLMRMMQPMHMHPMQPMQPMHMHLAHMQYTPPMGPIYLPRDCDRPPALPYLVLFAI